MISAAVDAARSALLARGLGPTMGGMGRLDLLEVVNLFSASPGGTYWSPCVKAKRALPDVLHGIFSFLQDVLISRKLLGNVAEIPGFELAYYIDDRAAKISDCIRQIEEKGGLIDTGQRVLSVIKGHL